MVVYLNLEEIVCFKITDKNKKLYPELKVENSNLAINLNETVLFVLKAETLFDDQYNQHHNVFNETNNHCSNLKSPRSLLLIFQIDFKIQISY